MENLTPRTREEEFLKGAAEGGTDLIPLPDVRREAFLKRLSDPTYPRPEGTKTREEWFLDQAAKGGGGSITVEELDVTENGTYTAPAMTAYNPVNVNVPLPENALLLKDIPSTPTAIATFSDGAEMVMPSLTVGIEAVQDLHGYDAPWVGGAGKNKAKPYSYTVTSPNGVTFTYNGDGSVTLNGTATASQAVPSVAIAVQNNLTFTLGSGTWIPSVSANNVTYEVYDTATSTLLSNGASFTLTEAKTVLFRVGAVNGQTYNNLKVYMQIESGSTATAYAPYSNICPISGWDEVDVTRTGKNLYSHNGISIYDYAFSQQIAFSQMRNPIFMKSGQKYVLSLSENITLFRMRAFDKFQNLVTNASIINAYNQGSGTGLVFYASGNFFGYNGAGSNSITTFQPTEDIWFDMTVQTTSPSQVMFEIGDTPSTYEPYNGQTYTINLGETRYGSEVDVVNGDGTDRLGKIVFDGSESWDIYTASGVNQVYTSVPNAISSASEVRTLCDTYKSISISNRANNFNTCYSGSNSICFNIENVTVAEWKARLQANNVTVVYELATPTTYDTQPTAVKSLVGDNNVFADSGEILEGEYLGGVS